MKLFDTPEPPNAQSFRAYELFRKLRARENLALVCGFVVVGVAELLHGVYFLAALDIWKVRGAFIPLIAVLSIASMVMSSSLQRALKEKKFANPVEEQVQCICQLFERSDPEAWRVFYLIARMAQIFMFGFGLIAGICVAAIFFG
jgi:hypothetical protein